MTTIAAPGTTTNPRRVLAVTALASFIAFLDVSVVNVAFPDMHSKFPSVSLSTLSWVVSGYAVFFAAVLTPVGRYADVFGRKAVFAWSMLGFTLMSALCAFAPNMDVLITARCLQGLAAGGLIPAGLGLVLAVYPPEGRVAAVAAWATAGSAAAALGPVLGGLLVWAYDWRAVFLINVPVGVVALLMTRGSVPEVRPGVGARPDPVGAILVGIGVGGVVVALTRGSEWGWTGTSFLVTIAVGALLLAAGLLRAVTHREPALEIGLWKDRKFAAASVVQFFFGVGMFAWLLACPLYCIAVWHYSVWLAGLVNSPGAITAAVGAAVVGRSKHPDIQRIATVLGCVCFAVSGVLFALFLHETPRFWTVWLPVGLLLGLGIGLVLTATASAAATSVPQPKFASGYGMGLTARQVGAGLGVAAFAAITAAVHSGIVDGIHDVFWFCALAMVPAALAALPMTGVSPTQLGDVAELPSMTVPH